MKISNTLQINEFWNNNHLSENVSVLSGVQYDETIDFLKIRNYLQKDCRVLEIGVGLGYVTRKLHDNGMKVSAVDISDIALNKIKDCCEKVYNVEELHELPSNYFDVIICNNVIQHIPTNVLVGELNEFIRSLNENGVFALEFVSSESSDDTGINPSVEDIQAGRLCRKPKYLEYMFEKIGGKCISVFEKKINIGILSGHHVFHITK